MKAAYLPFTFLSEDAVQVINNFFGEFIVYQPISDLLPKHLIELDKSGFIDIRIPVKKFAKKISDILVDYLSWMETNYKNKPVDFNFSKFFLNDSFFNSETSVSNILKEIKKEGRINDNIKFDDILFTVCLFLTIAQKNDFTNYQIDLKFQEFRKKEKLFSELLHGSKALNKFGLFKMRNFAENCDVFMCVERIKAWGTLVLQDCVIPDFLITSNYSVVKCLIGVNFLSSTFWKILGTFLVPISRNIRYEVLNERLLNVISKAINSYHETDEVFFDSKILSDDYFDGSAVFITIYVLPGISIKSFLMNNVSYDPELVVVDGNQTTISSSVLVYVN